MNVVLVNKSDLRGGAAVVSFRLMKALQRMGVAASMLVVEKLSQDPAVLPAAGAVRAKMPFLKERLRIFSSNGLSRANLFKVDTADSGLPLWRHPLVKQADVVMLNWINQGMLSLKGIHHIARDGKKIIWTMHDMWCMTGICHHAGDCSGYLKGNQCGNCPFLGKRAAAADLSHTILEQKRRLYADTNIHFVAVSNWLYGKCRESELLGSANISVIPNAFPSANITPDVSKQNPERKIELVMGAARLDDEIKGLDILIEATRHLKQESPELAAKLHINTFGDIRNHGLLQQIHLPHTHHGSISDRRQLLKLYADSHIVLSASRFETLPGTLVEGMAQGCLPVAFDRGGQRDIFTHGHTGVLVPFGASDIEAATNLADGIRQGCAMLGTLPASLLQSTVSDRFGEDSVARRYIDLL